MADLTSEQVQLMLRQRIAALEQESEGRRVVLAAKAIALRAEWIRAERAEQQLRDLRERIEKHQGVLERFAVAVKRAEAVRDDDSDPMVEPTWGERMSDAAAEVEDAETAVLALLSPADSPQVRPEVTDGAAD